MADVKWIKIVTDIFDDEKILLIESMPESDGLIVIWFKLLCLAGKNNNSGVFLLNEKIHYTDEMLATIFRKPINIVRLALNTFESFGMIEIINNVITIPNWDKHQTLDSIEKRRERQKEYMRERRAKQKLLVGGNKVPEGGLKLEEWKKVLKKFDYKCAYCGSSEGELEQEHIVPVNKGGKYEINNIVPACRSCNASKCDSDLDEWYRNQSFFDMKRLKKIKANMLALRKANVSSLEGEREEEREGEEDIYIDINKIIEKWNSLNLNKLLSIKNNRLKSLKSRIKEFSYEDVLNAIDNIKDSSFLKGNNNRKWTITFDWLLKPNNFIKVLEGNYIDKGGYSVGNGICTIKQDTGEIEDKFNGRKPPKLTEEERAELKRLEESGDF